LEFSIYVSFPLFVFCFISTIYFSRFLFSIAFIFTCSPFTSYTNMFWPCYLSSDISFRHTQDFCISFALLYQDTISISLCGFSCHQLHFCNFQNVSHFLNGYQYSCSFPWMAAISSHVALIFELWCSHLLTQLRIFAKQRQAR
jgi:hypothetical protein